jgi:hypothetical protein
VPIDFAPVLGIRTFFFRFRIRLRGAVNPNYGYGSGRIRILPGLFLCLVEKICGQSLKIIKYLTLFLVSSYILSGPDPDP